MQTLFKINDNIYFSGAIALYYLRFFYSTKKSQYFYILAKKFMNSS